MDFASNTPRSNPPFATRLKNNPSLLWLRQDLRLADHPALAAAVARGEPIIPFYIHDPAGDGAWPAGAASRWWLHHSLTALDAQYRHLGSRLVLRSGRSGDVLEALIKETGAGAVFWNRCYEPAAIARDKKIKEALIRQGLSVESFNGALLFEPWTLKTQAGNPYQVFTPFWKTILANPPPGAPLPSPKSLTAPARWPSSETLKSWALEPKIPWDAGFSVMWSPGEAGARAQLKRFLKDGVTDYPEGRDRPDQEGTSRLSPHLHFGEVTPRQIWGAVHSASAQSRLSRGADTYLREIGWREFAHHLIYHFPHTPEKPLREAFEKFPWKRDAAALKAWKKGLTGYPFVDAGMRELWTIGWMHNRVRMIVGSFLTKHLLTAWQTGARWFWDTLVDADLANNTLGWQWIAGCGADAAPYFRIFNPVIQGERFDPEGDYVRRWVPELKKLPAQWIHRPWEAPEDVLKAAGVELGNNYPRPIVDHKEARERALMTYKHL